jgi:hypothetical protein
LGSSVIQLEAHRDISTSPGIRLSKSAHPREAETSLTEETGNDCSIMGNRVSHRTGLVKRTAPIRVISFFLLAACAA